MPTGGTPPVLTQVPKAKTDDEAINGALTLAHDCEAAYSQAASKAQDPELKSALEKFASQANSQSEQWRGEGHKTVLDHVCWQVFQTCSPIQIVVQLKALAYTALAYTAFGMSTTQSIPIALSRSDHHVSTSLKRLHCTATNYPAQQRINSPQQCLLHA